MSSLQTSTDVPLANDEPTTVGTSGCPLSGDGSLESGRPGSAENGGCAPDAASSTTTGGAPSCRSNSLPGPDDPLKPGGAGDTGSAGGGILPIGGGTGADGGADSPTHHHAAGASSGRGSASSPITPLGPNAAAAATPTNHSLSERPADMTTTALVTQQQPTQTAGPHLDPNECVHHTPSASAAPSTALVDPSLASSTTITTTAAAPNSPSHSNLPPLARRPSYGPGGSPAGAQPIPMGSPTGGGALTEAVAGSLPSSSPYARHRSGSGRSGRSGRSAGSGGGGGPAHPGAMMLPPSNGSFGGGSREDLPAYAAGFGGGPLPSSSAGGGSYGPTQAQQQSYLMAMAAAAAIGGPISGGGGPMGTTSGGAGQNNMIFMMNHQGGGMVPVGPSSALDDSEIASTGGYSARSGRREEIDRANYTARLTRFYLKYNPEKLSRVDEFLAAYKGEEEQLFTLLVGKYGPEPEYVPTSRGGGGGGGMAASSRGAPSEFGGAGGSTMGGGLAAHARFLTPKLVPPEAGMTPEPTPYWPGSRSITDTDLCALLANMNTANPELLRCYWGVVEEHPPVAWNGLTYISATPLPIAADASARFLGHTWSGTLANNKVLVHNKLHYHRTMLHCSDTCAREGFAHERWRLTIYRAEHTPLVLYRVMWDPVMTLPPLPFDSSSAAAAGEAQQQQQQAQRVGGGASSGLAPTTSGSTTATSGGGGARPRAMTDVRQLPNQPGSAMQHQVGHPDTGANATASGGANGSSSIFSFFRRPTPGGGASAPSAATNSPPQSQASSAGIQPAQPMQPSSFVPHGTAGGPRLHAGHHSHHQPTGGALGGPAERGGVNVSATTSETMSHSTMASGYPASLNIPPQPQQPMAGNPIDAVLTQLRVMEARILERMTFLERRVSTLETTVDELRREIQPSANSE